MFCPARPWRRQTPACTRAAYRVHRQDPHHIRRQPMGQRCDRSNDRSRPRAAPAMSRCW